MTLIAIPRKWFGPRIRQVVLHWRFRKWLGWIGTGQHWNRRFWLYYREPTPREQMQAAEDSEIPQ